MDTWTHGMEWTDEMEYEMELGIAKCSKYGHKTYYISPDTREHVGTRNSSLHIHAFPVHKATKLIQQQLNVWHCTYNLNISLLVTCPQIVYHITLGLQLVRMT